MILTYTRRNETRPAPHFNPTIYKVSAHPNHKHYETFRISDILLGYSHLDTLVVEALTVKVGMMGFGECWDCLRILLSRRCRRFESCLRGYPRSIVVGFVEQVRLRVGS